MFVFGYLPPYEHLSVCLSAVRMYLSASCVCISKLAFVCAHVRVREVVCVSPSVRPSVYLSVCE